MKALSIIRVAMNGWMNIYLTTQFNIEIDGVNIVVLNMHV